MAEALLEAIGGVAEEKESVGRKTHNRNLFTLSLMPCSSHPQSILHRDLARVGLMRPAERGNFFSRKRGAVA